MLAHQKKKVAVIGSGFGGLAAAIRLQSQGISTTLFEKQAQPGGRAAVYRDQGFTFDAGPTVITAPSCFEELFDLSGKRFSDYVKLVPVDPFYDLCWSAQDHFSYRGDLESTLQQIRQRSPGDVAGYLKFLDYAEKVYQIGYGQYVGVPFLDLKSLFRAAPDLLRLKAYRSVYGCVSHWIQDPQLREALTFHALLVGGNPFRTSAIYTLIHILEKKEGVHFPMGGTGALVKALVELFQSLGGVLVLNAPVQAIQVRQGQVSGLVVEGQAYAFDAVVSNADVMHTYAQLLGHTQRGQSMARSLSKKHWSMSLFLIYFGTQGLYPQIAHHTVLFGPRYRGLLKDIFQTGRLAQDMSLYLHAPTRTDPSLAPPGHEAFYVLSPVPHLGLSHQAGGIDWSLEGPRYADRILSRLESVLLPDLRKKIVTQRIFTPVDFQSHWNAHEGSAFSLEPLLTQSAYFRVHNRDDHLGGLYFVGAGTHPGAGLPGVLNSAKATCRVILEDASFQV